MYKGAWWATVHRVAKSRKEINLKKKKKTAEETAAAAFKSLKYKVLCSIGYQQL